MHDERGGFATTAQSLRPSPWQRFRGWPLSFAFLSGATLTAQDGGIAYSRLLSPTQRSDHALSSLDSGSGSIQSNA